MSTAERRGDLRGPREERLFVKVLNCPVPLGLEDTTIGCRTQDVSSTGLQLALEQHLPADTELELWLEVKGLPGKYLLKGLVRWSREQSGAWVSGIELIETAEDTDIDDWQDLFV